MDTISSLFTGFLLSCTARHLSKNTIADYTVTLKKFISFVGESTPISSITISTIQEFLASFPDLTNKTLLNYHIGLSAFWTFLIEYGYTSSHLVQQIKRPKPEKREIIPFTQSEVKAMWATCNPKHGGRDNATNLVVEYRNRAMLLLMLDTGLRASEICDATISQFNRDKSEILVFGKGSKERLLKFSHKTTLSIWQYLNKRTSIQPHNYLFTTFTDNHIDRSSLGKRLKSIGRRAGVLNVHPHRFRHTFAINFLVNGGDIYTLKYYLGHATLTMCETYLSIAKADHDKAHQKASPVDNWNL